MWLLIFLVLSVVFIIVSTAQLKVHPFLALIFAGFGFGLLAGMPLADIVKSINDGFGGTIGYIGIVIVAGTIIGAFLEKSGGAFSIAERVLKITGKKNVPMAMGIVGYFVSMLVFCDSGFVILSPLNRALAKRAGITLAACAIALSLGLYSTHTMVPPAAGPIAAAGILGADIGQTIMCGLFAAFAAMAVGWLFAIKVAAKVYIDPEPELTEQEIEQRLQEAPGAGRAATPLLVPIVLIALRSISVIESKPFGTGHAASLIGFVGSPVVALLIGVFIAFSLPKRFSRDLISTTGWVGEALKAAAIIIMITGAGGAFGRVLQNSGIADAVGDLLGGANLGIWLPFIFAAAIKSSQGSSTVAIITTAGLMAPLMGTFGFDSTVAKSLVVVAIGAGSMVVSHSNDSYFWVVTQFSGMDVKQGYKLQTPGTLLAGLAAATVVWVESLILL